MPSEHFDAYPVHLPEEHSLDFLSKKEVPESYSWTDKESSENNKDYPFVAESSVPIIDLQNPNACEVIGHACRTWGIFQVINHGVPLRLLEEVEGESRNLFSLPVEQKLKAARSLDDISGYGFAHISPFFSKKMWYEGFTITGPPLQHARQLWPQNYTKFCEVIEEYKKEMKNLAVRLLWLMLISLGIYNKEEIEWAGPEGDFPEANAVLNLNSYPTCPDPDRAMGMGAHTDSVVLTILYQDGSGGLQVLKEGEGWVPVPSISGALVVNVGDMLQILSNGLYHSVMHRALPNKTHDRISVPYLYMPPDNVSLLPLPTLITPSHPPLYRTVTWKEYMDIKGKLFNKALSYVQLSDDGPTNRSKDSNESLNVEKQGI